METMSEKPRVSSEDRSEWRYEDGGPALLAAHTFIGLLKSPDLSDRLAEVKDLVTAESWPTWTAHIQEGLSAPFLNEFTHQSTRVRYPAEGMAYVLYPVLHPDQTDPVTIETPTVMAANWVTLLLEGDQWKVHQIGELVAPAALGKQAYSW